MAKTKKEIQYHLNNTAYNKIGSHKIVAFLLGHGIIKKGEKLSFKAAEAGEKFYTFTHFYEWFNKTSSKEVLDSIFVDLGDRLEWAIKNERWDCADRVALQIEFLVDAFNLKEENTSEIKCE